MMGLVGVPSPNSGAGHGVGGPKGMLHFCCTYIKTQRVTLNVKIQMSFL